MAEVAKEASSKTTGVKREVDEEKQRELELRLFGTGSSSTALWAVKSEDESSESDEDEKSDAEEPQVKKAKKTPSAAVWEDEDDANAAVDVSYLRKIAPDSKIGQDFSRRGSAKQMGKELRQKYADLAGVARKPEWVQKIEEEKKEMKKADDSEDSDEEDAIAALSGMTKTSKKWLTKGRALPREYLQANRLPDPTAAHHSGGLRALRFHPTQPVLVVGGPSTVQLFQIAESTTNLQRPRGDCFLQSVSIKRFNLEYMALHDDGASAFLSSSKSRSFYSYNLLDGHLNQFEYPGRIEKSGRFGSGVHCRVSPSGRLLAVVAQLEVHVFVLKTMEHVHTFKANSEVSDLCFSAADDKKLYALTATGISYVWDLRSLKSQHTFQDEGSFRGTTLSLSPNDQFVACGSNTGIVNVYNTAEINTSVEPTPLYALTNLTTAVNFLQFNRNNEMLAIGSRDKAMAYRVVHMQSGTVFKNFPAKQEMLGKSHFCAADFSPNGGLAAFGEATGPVRLYRFNHYASY